MRFGQALVWIYSRDSETSEPGEDAIWLRWNRHHDPSRLRAAQYDHRVTFPIAAAPRQCRV
jgi:hypothetical protein